MFSPKLELNAEFMFTDIDNKTGADFSAGIKADVTPKLGLVAFYEMDENSDVMSIDAKYFFVKKFDLKSKILDAEWLIQYFPFSITISHLLSFLGILFLSGYLEQCLLH